MNLQLERITALCDELQLVGLDSQRPVPAPQAARAEASFADFPKQVLRCEHAARIERKRDALLKFAGLPAIKTLEQFDWAAGSGAYKAQIQELAAPSLVGWIENVMSLGPSGVGKTHVATALTYKATMAEHKVGLIAAADLTSQLVARYGIIEHTLYLSRSYISERSARS